MNKRNLLTKFLGLVTLLAIGWLQPHNVLACHIDPSAIITPASVQVQATQYQVTPPTYSCSSYGCIYGYTVIIEPVNNSGGCQMQSSVGSVNNSSGCSGTFTPAATNVPFSNLCPSVQYQYKIFYWAYTGTAPSNFTNINDPRFYSVYDPTHAVTTNGNYNGPAGSNPYGSPFPQPTATNLAGTPGTKDTHYQVGLHLTTPGSTFPTTGAPVDLNDQYDFVGGSGSIPPANTVSDNTKTITVFCGESVNYQVDVINLCGTLVGGAALGATVSLKLDNVSLFSVTQYNPQDCVTGSLPVTSTGRITGGCTTIANGVHTLRLTVNSTLYNHTTDYTVTINVVCPDPGTPTATTTGPGLADNANTQFLCFGQSTTVTLAGAIPIRGGDVYISAGTAANSNTYTSAGGWFEDVLPAPVPTYPGPNTLSVTIPNNNTFAGSYASAIFAPNAPGKEYYFYGSTWSSESGDVGTTPQDGFPYYIATCDRQSNSVATIGFNRPEARIVFLADITRTITETCNGTGLKLTTTLTGGMPYWNSNATTYTVSNVLPAAAVVSNSTPGNAVAFTITIPNAPAAGTAVSFDVTDGNGCVKNMTYTTTTAPCCPASAGTF